MDCFGLGGVLVHEDDVRQVVSMYGNFKKKWNLNYPLHSTKIRGQRGSFSWLGRNVKETKQFHEDLQELMAKIPVIGFAAIVDRPGYNQRYKEEYGESRWSLCKTAYSILLERATKYCRERGATMEVVMEQSGHREERLIITYHRELKSSGHPFDVNRASGYDGLQAEDYKQTVMGEPSIGTKKNIFLQIADIYLYSMAKHGYDELHSPWLVLIAARRIVDAHIAEDSRHLLGVKYSCFD
jgi:hypothetical protein